MAGKFSCLDMVFYTVTVIIYSLDDLATANSEKSIKTNN
jgi:hypothetical protein